jgi:hypothetical protein
MYRTYIWCLSTPCKNVIMILSNHSLKCYDFIYESVELFQFVAGCFVNNLDICML